MHFQLRLKRTDPVDKNDPLGRASLSICAFFDNFLNGSIDPAGRRLRIEEYPMPESRIELLSLIHI